MHVSMFIVHTYYWWPSTSHTMELNQKRFVKSLWLNTSCLFVICIIHEGYEIKRTYMRFLSASVFFAIASCLILSRSSFLACFGTSGGFGLAAENVLKGEKILFELHIQINVKKCFMILIIYLYALLNYGCSYTMYSYRCVTVVYFSTYLNYMQHCSRNRPAALH